MVGGKPGTGNCCGLTGSLLGQKHGFQADAVLALCSSSVSPHTRTSLESDIPFPLFPPSSPGSFVPSSSCLLTPVFVLGSAAWPNGCCPPIPAVSLCPQVTEHPQLDPGMLGCTAALPSASLRLPHCKKMAKANITRDIIHRQIKVGVSPCSVAGVGTLLVLPLLGKQISVTYILISPVRSLENKHTGPVTVLNGELG